MKALAIVAFAVLVQARVDTPRFAPAEKSAVEKSFSGEIRFATTQVTSISVEGEDGGGLLRFDGELLTFRQRTRLSVTDSYVQSKHGRPIVLDRTFDDLEQTDRLAVLPFTFGPLDPKVTEPTRFSALRGKTVRFTWNERSENYDAKLTARAPELEPLTGLTEGLDFREYVPNQDATVGDEWTIDGKAFACLILPGGDLHFETEDKQRDDKRDEFSRGLASNLSGKLQLELAEVRVQDGRRLAVITLEGELQSKSHLNTPKFVADVLLRPKGELLWDLEANRIHAVHVESRLELTAKLDVPVVPNVEPPPIFQYSMRMEGTLESRLSTKTP